MEGLEDHQDKEQPGDSITSKFEEPIKEFTNLIEDEAFELDCCVKDVKVFESKVNHCSTSCINSCSEIFSSWSSEDLNLIRNLAKHEKGTKVKTALLHHLEAQVRFGFESTSYIVKRREFCLDFFSYMTGCSVYTLKSVLQDFHNGQVMYSHGGLGAIRPDSVKTVKAICWLKCFREDSKIYLF